MKINLIFLFVFVSLQVFSQDPQNSNYELNEIDFDGFKYKNQYYETRPRGLKEFLKYNGSDFSTNLKSELLKMSKSIKTRDILSEISYWGFFAAGSYISFDAVANSDFENDPTPIFKGLGVAVVGYIISSLLRPKDRDYFNFINKINRESSNKANIKVTANYKNNLNLGLAINF